MALAQKAAEETGALNPHHLGVPWVTVAGQALGGEDATLATLPLFVCAFAAAAARPAVCTQFPLEVNAS